MKDRIRMNTESLQKEFPEVYEEFFVNHDLVVSGCFSLRWGASGVGHSSNNIRIKQKMPLKIYVGINEVPECNVILNKIYFYEVINNQFKNIIYYDINKQKERLEKFILSFLKENNYNNGLNISFLSETGRGHGFSFSGSSFSTLAIGIFLLIGKLNTKDIVNYDEFVKGNIFKEIYLFALQCEFISKQGNANGDGVISTLLNTSTPVVHITEKFDNKININLLKDIKYNYEILEEEDLPIDFCILYTGYSSNADKIEKYIKKDIKSFNLYENFLTKILSNRGLNNSNIYVKKFEKKNSIYENLTDSLIILNVITLKLFKEIKERGYDKELINKFINNINAYNRALFLIEKENTFISSIEYNFWKNVVNQEEKIGLFPIYSGKLGGGYLVVMKQNISRATIVKTIENISNSYPNVKIEYASWLDGTSSDGVKVEQFVSEEKYSKYFDKNKLILETNKGKKILGEHGDLIKQIGKGILVDTINRKILVNGKKLTSKDIPSQATTVEVLSVLLENNGKEVSNDIFETSSYSKNKNDMIGKIVIPLKKLTKKYFGKEIDILCKGSLIEFQMILKEKNINIGIIKKI